MLTYIFLPQYNSSLYRPFLTGSFLSVKSFIDPFFLFCDDLSWPVISFQWWPLLTRAFLSVTVTSFTDSFFPFSDVLHYQFFPISDELNWPKLFFQWWPLLTHFFLSVMTLVQWPFFVSVTTFTDVVAFFVGSNTLLPGLESFCIYAAVAIFAIFALQVFGV